MGKYLSIAQRVPRQNETGESTKNLSAVNRRSPEAWRALCKSSQCAGCYDVGEGRKIHPPRCGLGCKGWLKRSEMKGKVQ